MSECICNDKDVFKCLDACFNASEQMELQSQSDEAAFVHENEDGVKQGVYVFPEMKLEGKPSTKKDGDVTEYTYTEDEVEPVVLNAPNALSGVFRYFMNPAILASMIRQR